ncbi:MAG: hypothetical protein AABO41_23920 [Acidobacteriota bacterium]
MGSIRASSRDDQTVLLVNGVTGDAKQYKEGLEASLTDFSGVVLTNPNGLGAYQEGDSTVVVFDSANKQVARFPTYPIVSMAVLSNGNVLVASPVGKRFLHLYTSSGRLLKSFGALKNYSLPNVDDGQKKFFHKGKVLVDASDNIYYAFHYVPVIQEYSSTGKLQFERQVEGKAIDMQQELADRFLSTKARGSIGGIDIINSAALDPMTGHLWVCMNGSSDTGVVYEYSEKGEKLREYALRTSFLGWSKQRVAGVKDIALTRSNLYTLTTQQQVLVFNIRDESTWGSTDDEGSFHTETACGTGQAWNACTFNCPEVACSGGNPTANSSNGSTLDCKAALQSVLQPGHTLMSSTCTTFVPGSSGPPPHARGACKDDVVVCLDGQNFTASVTIDCPAPPSDSCSGGDELCFAYWQGESYCGQPANFLNYSSTGCGQFYSYDNGGCCCGNGGPSPILIDLRGNGFDMTNARSGVNFDIDNDGVPEHLSWTSANSDDAWLALDRNGNGRVDNGGELFGNFTAQPSSDLPNGFLALAEFDKPENGGNGDGRIDSRDSVFTSLRLWRDANHNGVSENSEAYRLRALGITALDLDYRVSKRIDQYGNGFRYRSKVYDTRGAHVGQWAWDVFLVKQ